MAGKTKRGRGESTTSPRRLKAVENQKLALELRIAGHTLDYIAQQVGYKQACGAKAAIEAALKATVSEPAEKVRELERQRLDKMLVAIWPSVTGYKKTTLNKDGNPVEVDVPPSLEAQDRAIKIMQRRAALDGLDAPKETRIAGSSKEKAPIPVAHTYPMLPVDKLPSEVLEHLIALTNQQQAPSEPKEPTDVQVQPEPVWVDDGRAPPPPVS